MTMVKMIMTVIIMTITMVMRVMVITLATMINKKGRSDSWS